MPDRPYKKVDGYNMNNNGYADDTVRIADKETYKYIGNFCYWRAEELDRETGEEHSTVGWTRRKDGG